MLADSYGTEAETRFAVGEPKKTIALLHKSLDINKKIKNLWGQSYVSVLLHIAYFDRGEPKLAIQTAVSAIDLGDKSGLLASSFAMRCDLAWAYGCYGNIEKGFPIAEEAHSLAE